MPLKSGVFYYRPTQAAHVLGGLTPSKRPFSQTVRASRWGVNGDSPLSQWPNLAIARGLLDDYSALKPIDHHDHVVLQYKAGIAHRHHRWDTKFAGYDGTVG